MGNVDAVLASAAEMVIGRLHYLRLKPNPNLGAAVDFHVQITYHDDKVPPAFLRQAARELARQVSRIADEMADPVDEVAQLREVVGYGE